jgi:hypothetical protein
MDLRSCNALVAIALVISLSLDKRKLGCLVHGTTAHLKHCLHT